MRSCPAQKKQNGRKPWRSLEIDSLHSNDVWDVVELPKGWKVVGSKWVFKRNLGPDGIVEWHRARLVAQGFSKKFGVDNLRRNIQPSCPFLVCLNSNCLSLTTWSETAPDVDITTAFLNGELQAEVYMKQPEGFITTGQELVCKLKPSIYGLKHAGNMHALDGQLKEMSSDSKWSMPVYQLPQKEKSLSLLCMSMTSSWLERVTNWLQ